MVWSEVWFFKSEACCHLMSKALVYYLIVAQVYISLCDIISQNNITYLSDLKVGKYETLIDSPTWQKDLHVQSYFQFKVILFNKLPARLNQITPEQKSDIAENCLHLRSCDAKISETT